MKIDYYIDDRPITDDYDLWKAIDGAQTQLRQIIAETSRKDIREPQQKASDAVFENLKTLIMDYVKR